MQLSARGFECAWASDRQPVALRAWSWQLRHRPPGAVWSPHGGRQLMREPLGGAGPHSGSQRGLEVQIRELERPEIHDIWSIDRAEVVDKVYYRVGKALVLKSEHHDVKGWPPGEPERDGPILLDCFDHGGTFYGAFDGKILIGATMLESRFIGRERDQLQLKFLHVSRRHRRAGLGCMLFDKAVAKARELGARRLYISATPSENTVRFYLRRGCRVTDDIDTALFKLEPEDVHLEFGIPV